MRRIAVFRRAGPALGAAALAILAGTAAAAPQGAVVTQLTTGTNTQGDTNPTWSPAGDRVVYESRDAIGPSYPTLYYMDTGGGAEVQFTGAGELAPAYEQPCYSPDGAWVVYAKQDGSWYHLYVRPAAGGAEQAITTGPAGPSSSGFYGDHYPAWSPDGKWIAFASSRDSPSFGFYGIYRVKPDGTGLQALTGVRVTDTGWPSWARDGSRVLFSENDEIWQYSLTGGGATKLWNGGTHPAVSPDGLHVAYSELGDILVRNDPAGPPIVITSGSSTDEAPAWSPDGRTLAFASRPVGGYRAIWLAHGVDQLPARAVTLGQVKDAYR